MKVVSIPVDPPSFIPTDSTPGLVDADGVFAPWPWDAMMGRLAAPEQGGEAVKVLIVRAPSADPSEGAANWRRRLDAAQAEARAALAGAAGWSVPRGLAL